MWGRSAIGLPTTGCQISRRGSTDAVATLDAVLDLRLYRVTLLPFAVLMVVAAFSLHTRRRCPPARRRPRPSMRLRRRASCSHLAAAYPDRTPGSAGDDALAETIAHHPRRAAWPTRASPACARCCTSIETTTGAAAVPTVIATRAGTGAGSSAGIALIADRGGGQGGSVTASLAPTATLLELAAIFKTLVPAAPADARLDQRRRERDGCRRGDCCRPAPRRRS